MNWNDRLKLAREQAKLGKSKLAKLVGVSAPTMTDWESGAIKELKADNLMRVCHALNLNPLWLQSGQGPMRNDPQGAAAALPQQPLDASYPRPASETDFALIPHYDVKGSCGSGHLNGHVEVKGGLAFQRTWLERLRVKPESASVIYAEGDSMAPTIHDGDVVLLDLTQTEPRTRLVYAFLAHDEVRIKRVFQSLTGDWTLVSDNPDKTRYPDERVLDPASLTIIGRCVWQGGAL